MSTSRYDKGLAVLDKLNSRSGERVLESLKDICPDMARMVIEFAYGDIWSRSGLDLRTRELITIASLVTQGFAKEQLNAHLHNALNAGCTPEEIVETIMQMSVYAGFPAALGGFEVAKDVFQEKGLIKKSDD